MVAIFSWFKINNVKFNFQSCSTMGKLFPLGQYAVKLLQKILLAPGFWLLPPVLFYLPISPAQPAAADSPEEKILKLLEEDRPYTVVSAALFDQLGWDLPPDGGASVKALADAAPGGAFAPEELEKLPPEKLGYRARWHVVRYKWYGLDWDITGLHLMPNRALANMPTVAIIHGGSANWYEFFLDPLNNPGLGQYLAQRVPVLLITIPGNYRPGGWVEPNESRVPPYVLGRKLTAEELKVRNAVYTFRVVTEGVKRLIETATAGPVLIVGHSTGGEIQFLLNDSPLKARLGGLSLGWGTGGPAIAAKRWDEKIGERSRQVERVSGYPPVWQLRPRSAEGYVGSRYVGPLNPIPGKTELEVAKGWFEREGRRRPHFKQVLQDMEHLGMVEHRARLEREIRQALAGNRFGIKVEEVLSDLFSTVRVPLTGYRKMLWLVARKDNGHWNEKEPERSRELGIANQFREANPGIPIRVVLFDLPMTHYGHIERPRQLAGAFLVAVKWLAGE